MVGAVLNKKLFRDLMSLKAQVISISLVVGIGVAVLFGFTSTHRSLMKSRDDFYESANFSNLFVRLKKAPLYLVKELRKIKGVTDVEPRLEYDALLSIPNFVEPVVGHFVSIPDGMQPEQNKLFIHKGRLPSRFAVDEIVVSENFFKVHQFKLGDFIFATLNGKKKKLKIVGVGVTPEYVIAIQPGSAFPDDFHFSVIWMNQSVLAGTYDMRASFNSVVLRTKREALEEKLIYRIDQILDKYGSTGAYGLDKQVSSVYVREELNQLKVQAAFIPILFFLVAAFILNVVISRLVRAQRSEIATLKAVGYFDFSISGYYFKIAALIVLVGTVIGVLLGIWIGDSMIRLYADFYHFPVLSYDFSYYQIFVAVVVSIATAGSGVYSSLRKIFKLQPAEAMRPPSPPSFHQGFFENSRWFQLFQTRTRMMIRGITVFPGRALLTGFGLSFAIVLLVSGLFWQDTIDYLILAQYTFIEKETGSIQLTQSTQSSVVYEVLRQKGVLEAEGYYRVGVKARFQNREEMTALNGFPHHAKLQGIVDQNLKRIELPDGGIYIGRILANQLGVIEGDQIEIEVLEGRKPKAVIRVQKIVDNFMSNEIITSRKNVAKIMKTDDLVNRILFRAYSDSTELYSQLKEMPTVLTVNYRDGALKMFNETSAQYLLVFSFIFSLFAGAIGFGIAYNNMRVTLAERD
ncbi:MAG: hypothetical protein CL678_15110 [Bdellovibrionaceae bacterium]|nr:hypothetical protein [Pseudobdellovibrionaceae bacterium]|tara:strand:+ start:2431 stop:4494 length:2064 start_codon:yes stop_codon:yes gene_type:complete